MTSLEIIEELKQSTFIDEDGEEYNLEFQDGLTEEQIEDLKHQFPKKHIPEELVQILKVTKGWDGYGPEMVYFGHPQKRINYPHCVDKQSLKCI